MSGMVEQRLKRKPNLAFIVTMAISFPFVGWTIGRMTRERLANMAVAATTAPQEETRCILYHPDPRFRPCVAVYGWLDRDKAHSFEVDGADAMKSLKWS